MKLNLVKIGNSQGIRLPKSLLQQLKIADTIEVEVREGEMILRAPQHPRAGWSEAFAAAAHEGQDDLVEWREFSNEFDDSEWEWK